MGCRTIFFAGREWIVKAGFGGPGPNNWSDSFSSVWVDADGLHLKIRKVGSIWYCAEVFTNKSTQYGIHRFYIANRIDQFDKNIVASPFLYADDNCEIDIEFSSWCSDSQSYRSNSQYVVQPYDKYGNRNQFKSSLKGNYSTHYINWQSDYIGFKSFHGHYEEPPGHDYLIKDWTYRGTSIPPISSNLGIRLNLWLIGAKPPSDGHEAELIIKNADLPSPPPGVPQITH